MTAKKDKDAEHSVGAAQPDKSKGEVPNPVDPLLYEAFGLVSEDHKERASFDHPYELQLRKLFVHDWLRTLAKDLAGGKYGPKAAAPIVFRSRNGTYDLVRALRWKMKSSTRTC